MTLTTHLPGQRCGADPLGHDHVQLTLEDDVAVIRPVCPCGKPTGSSTPMTGQELALFPELVRRARRNALTTVTLAVVDFKEVAR